MNKTTSMSDIRFRLTINCIGVAGLTLMALTCVPEIKAFTIAMLVFVSLGFILSCIDYVFVHLRELKEEEAAKIAAKIELQKAAKIATSLAASTP